MTLFSHNQMQSGRWGRAVLSVVLVAWLTTALQPCLMAMEISPPATAMSVSMGDHDGHASHEDASTSHHCPHCPAADSLSQDACRTALQADCEQSPDYYDVRTSSVKAKESPGDAPIGLAPPIADTSLHECLPMLFAQTLNSCLPGSPPSLTLLHAVYLI